MSEDSIRDDEVADDGPSPRARARSLGGLYICGSLLALVWTRLPHPYVGGDAVVVLMAVVALVAGVLLVCGAADAVPTWGLHLLLGGIQLVISVAFVAASLPDNDIRWFYAWATPFAAFFFSRRAAAGHAVWVAGVMATSLVVMGAPVGRALSVWSMTIGTVTAVTVLVGWASASIHATNARSRHAALHDPLTGLGNRRLFARDAHEALKAHGCVDGAVHVLLIDLDAFKLVNDTHGHQAGDQLLVALSMRLTDAVHAGDTVARLGGDEFAIVCSHMPAAHTDEDEDESFLNEMLQSLQAVWAEPFELAHGPVWTSGSIGVSRSVTGADASSMLREADAAMYRAKGRGRGRHAEYDHRMREDAASWLQLDRALREVLALQQLRLVYQPVVDLHTGRAVGVEALLRWTHPELGVVTPDRFIPLAESNGLIGPIGAWVLDHAAEQAAAWRAAGAVDDTFWVAVNVSGAQLLPTFADDVVAALERHGLPSTALVIELTESVLLDDEPVTATVLAALTASGLRLHLDDFGTGYSALAYLTRIPLHALKIDRSFVADITVSQRRRSVVQAIISMAQALGLDVVAEGVETPEQAAELLRLGCATAQGHLFGRPLPPEDVGRDLTAGASGVPSVTR